MGGIDRNNKAQTTRLRNALAVHPRVVHTGHRGSSRYSVLPPAGPAASGAGQQPKEKGRHPAVDAWEAIRPERSGYWMSHGELDSFLKGAGWAGGASGALLVADDYDLDWVKTKGKKVMVVADGA